MISDFALQNFMSGHYRRASSLDYDLIASLLYAEKYEDVLVRSLASCEQEPYPLSERSRGPYSVTKDGLHGFTKNDIPCLLRITSTSLQNVEIRRSGEDWYAPEMGG